MLLMKHLTKTLICAILMLSGFYCYGQSISTLPLKPMLLSKAPNKIQKPVNKNNSIATAYENDTLLKRVDEVETTNRQKARASSVEINKTETWGEWEELGSADMTTGYAYSDFHQEVSVYKRYSTVSGHEKIFQIKIPGLLDGYDAIFWGEEDDRQPGVVLKNEYIDYNHTYNGNEAVAIGCTGIAYYKALGTIYIDNVWHFVESNYSSGYCIYAYYIIQLRDMPEYSETLRNGVSSDYYPASTSQVTIDFTRTENIAEIRYKVFAMGYPGPDYTFSIPDVDFDKDEGVVALSKDENSITVNIEGRQEYVIDFMCYTAEGVAIFEHSRRFWSMQEDGKQWQTLGTAKYADKSVQWHYQSGNYLSVEHNNGVWGFQDEEYNNLKLDEWDVELQQCVDEPTLYRLVNPYANCPYIGQQVNLISYEQNENGEYVGSVFASYTPQYDNSQNYYLYLYSDNDLSENNRYTHSQYRPLSGLKISDDGVDFENLLLRYYYAFTEDKYISFDYSSSGNYAKLPGYIDYKFTTEYNSEDDIVTIVAADAENVTIRYQITANDGSYTSEEKDVPANGQIDLKAEGLISGVAYTISIMSYDSKGSSRIAKTMSMTYGYTDWEYWSNATCTTWLEGGTSQTFKRHEKSNPNHEQYKIDTYYFTPIIDAEDVTNKISDRYIPVTLQPTSIDVYDIMVADAYTYTQNDTYKESSYFDIVTGLFNIYAVYYDEEGVYAVQYDKYKLDGYTDITVTMGTQTIVDNKYVQDVKVELEMCAYAKYGFYNSDEYSSEEALAALIADENAQRITETTTLQFSEVGSFYFIVIAYDNDGNELMNKIVSFTVKEPFDFSKWTYIGKSTVADGWVIGGLFGAEPTEYLQEVDTYASTDNGDIIGLYGFYNNDFYDYIFDSHGDDVMITIDASDRNFITIVPQDTGCKTYDISIANFEGYFYSTGYSKEEIIADMESENKTYIENENIIIIPSPVVVYNGNGYYVEPASINLPDDFKFGAVNSLDIDKNATLEYYNLNGVRINGDNLVPGLYIRREGEKVSKVVVK